MVPTNADLWSRLLAIVASTLAAFGVAVGGFVFTEMHKRITTIDGVTHGMAISIAEILTSMAAHEREAERWKERIDTNTQRLHRLSNDSAARPDPFTGSEGRKMERRIDKLEIRIAVLPDLKKQVDRLAQDLREMEGFYREHIAPVYEPSNGVRTQSHEHGQ